MLNWLTGFFEKRSFDAAGGGRRWSNVRTMPSTQAAILGQHDRIRQRAQYQVRNNPWLANGINTLIANAVGTGIAAQSQHRNPEVRQAIDRLFSRWSDECDATGNSDWAGLQGLALRQVLEGGESFGRLRVRRQSDGLSVPLQVELLDPDQVPNHSRELGGNGRIVAGVEFDAVGRRTAYHVYRWRPGIDPGPVSTELVRVRAEDMVHVFEPITAGQVRGVSRLASVLLRIHTLDAFEDATLERQKTAALFAAFIRDYDGGAAGLGAGSETIDLSLEPGAMHVLPGNSSIEFSKPPDSIGYSDFVSAQLRAIAAGMGVPEAALSGDLSKANYSSLRAGLIEFRRRIEQLQYSILVHQFCRPIWKRFVTTAVLSGALPVSEFETNRSDYFAVKWVPPGWSWVDPEKDAKAEVLLIDNKIKSRYEAIAERGFDPEAVDKEIARDEQRLRGLGVGEIDAYT